MKDTGKVAIFVTASSDTEAHKIADLLLTKRKAACVNIVPAVESSFWWLGKLDSVRESLLIIKTKAGLLPDYLKWIDDEVTGS
jgi:periplasmic divalent cation tolerance protein